MNENSETGPNWYPVQIPETQVVNNTANGEAPKQRFPFFDAQQEMSATALAQSSPLRSSSRSSSRSSWRASS
eukprot:CAMPEP_0168445916 /NCGR_PEP_ID=MMETSP0228-20121227/45809_1 /TAXON_ID=133427 /ORGANISM="Protoceratium reticulatum, Strain CCCM 535 (=CCMP 1889)" /LENGTH=71 /DNA_ID=CAMNT_0008460401 /DNA_START=5 /DNA_END=216 /DNA_ORIENTATION=-